MSLYKDASKLAQSSDPLFEQLRHPGQPTPRSGIYMCVNCGHEIVSSEGHPLPPQNHHQHNDYSPILWKLLVYADHRHWSGK